MCQTQHVIAMPFDPEQYLEATTRASDPAAAAAIAPPPPKARSRSRERSRERRHRSSSRERGRDKDRDRDVRDRDRDRDRERERERDRDRERGRDGRDARDRDHGRERERGRDDRGRSRERERRTEREDDDPIKRVEREAEKQRRDLDRDLRTVFVSQVTIRATRDDLEEFFSQAGKVAEVHLIRDTRTKKSKGLAYIEMDSVESVPKALALCGQLVLGLPCIVQASQAERNRDALVRLNQQNNPVEVPRLAIENLDAKTTEIDMMRVFETYGIIEQVEISRDAQGRSRGSASVTFRRMEDARKAQATLDRQDMNGRPMHITMNTKVVSGPSAGGGGGGVRSQVEALDDNDENGVTLTAQSRAQLMQKLQRGDSAGIPPPPVPISVQPMAPAQPAGPKNFQDIVLQLSHMFDIKDPDVGEPNFFEELQEDVAGECSKFGKVKDCIADRRHPSGRVLVRFFTVPDCVCAQQKMHGRFFAKRQILTEYLTPEDFDQLKKETGK